jgi:hypothetical protein
MDKGKNTSEWMTTVGAIMGSVLPVLAVLMDQLAGSGLIKNPHWLAVIGMVGAVLASLGYGAGRTYLKATEMKTKALTQMGKSQDSPSATDT